MEGAKYYEDNNKLIDERLSLSKSLHIDTSIMSSPVVTLPKKDGVAKTHKPRTCFSTQQKILRIEKHHSKHKISCGTKAITILVK